MAEKYRAIIHGDRIEWEDEAPQGLTGNRTITVDVTPVAKRRASASGKKAAEILRKIAAIGGVVPIKDPSKWQREIRKDRPLPGRD
ncbi:MAG TPA: hypothetical protein PLK77_07610 [Pyrinomonadaceae bacterium]|nr:hypothetical protein [Pyrinomonadaceae bacterium]